MTLPSPRRVGSALAIAGDMMLAPTVIMMRLPLMLTEADASGRIGAETLRAVTEKTAAFAEGMAAANLSYFNALMSFWPQVLSGRTPSLLSGAAHEHALHAALKPSGKRVRANYRRLSRKR